jgi:hypothetical protein
MCSLSVKDGLISECVIEGSEKFRKVSEKLIGCRHMVSDMEEFFKRGNILLNDIDIFNFF